MSCRELSLIDFFVDSFLSDKSLEILVDCVQIALKQYSPSLAEDRQSLEDNLDLPSVYKIIEAASGVKLADSNALLNTVLAPAK